MTTQTSETCNIEQSTIFETRCTFAVQTVICGNISGMFSDDILLRLKGITAMSYYTVAVYISMCMHNFDLCVCMCVCTCICMCVRV